MQFMLGVLAGFGFLCLLLLAALIVLIPLGGWGGYLVLVAGLLVARYLYKHTR